MKVRRKRIRGQTTLEYALVIGVIAVGVIVVGKHFFGKKDAGAGLLMEKALQSATGQIDGGSAGP